MTRISDYYDRNKIAEMATDGRHREAIGGLWDEIGALQLDFLKANGLVSTSKLLDIGCGSLRLGVRAVEYLDAGHYWGTDINESLLTAGYDKEIVAAGLASKLPRNNLITDGDFDFTELPRDFDFIIAQSVFTHLPIEYMRSCLNNLADHIVGPCSFFLTVFIVPDDAIAQSFIHPGGVQTHPDRDPYHYSNANVRQLVSGTSWRLEYLGDWNHPRSQQIAILKQDR